MTSATHPARARPWRRLANTMLLPVAIVTALIGIGWYLQGRTTDTEPPPPVQLDEPEDARAAARHAAPGVGRLAPDFTLDSLAGPTLAPTDFRGQPVILLFWATWCEPCVEEMPLLADLVEEHAESRLTILAVNIEESRDEVEAFAEGLSMPFPFLLDEDGEVAERFRIVGVPSTFFIDRDGILRAQFFGPVGDADLDRLLPAILEEQDPQ